MKSGVFLEYVFDQNEINKYKKSVNYYINKRMFYIKNLIFLLNLHYPVKIKILLLPQQFRMGEYLGEGIIHWGMPNKFPSYQAIGIFHEYLHYAFEQVHEVATDDERWRLHGLIVLLADVYLRFLIYPTDGFVLPTVDAGYHERLVVETMSLLPAFEKAVKNKSLSAEYLLELFKLPSLSR
jgi:hypothetical protein